MNGVKEGFEFRGEFYPTREAAEKAASLYEQMKLILPWVKEQLGERDEQNYYAHDRNYSSYGIARMLANAGLWEWLKDKV